MVGGDDRRGSCPQGLAWPAVAAAIILAALACGGSGNGLGDPAPAPQAPSATPAPRDPQTPPAPKASFTITVARDGDGSGTVEGGPIACGSICSGALAEGSTLTLTATPDATSEIGSWTVPGCQGSRCMITVRGNLTAGVTFRRVPNPPARSEVCGDDCRVQIDEFIPRSFALRDDLGMLVDSQGLPRISSSAGPYDCWGVPPSAFEAARADGRWVRSERGSERSIVPARSGETLAALTFPGFLPFRFRLDLGAGWVDKEAPDIWSHWEDSLQGDSRGRFHLLATRLQGGRPQAVYAIWDGKWTVTPTTVIPSGAGIPSPEVTPLGMTLTRAGDARIAFWSKNFQTMMRTLQVADPLGNSTIALQEPMPSATIDPNEESVLFALTERAGAETPHVLTVRRMMGRSGSIDEGGPPLEVLYVTRDEDRFVQHVLAQNSSVRTSAGKQVDGAEAWDYDEWSFWPVAVVARGAEVRLLYTGNHLTGRVTYRETRSGPVWGGGTNAQELRMAWVEKGKVKTRVIGTGFLRYFPSPVPFQGHSRPLARGRLDEQGRIHLVGESAGPGVYRGCGPALRYLLIAGDPPGSSDGGGREEGPSYTPVSHEAACSARKPHLETPPSSATLSSLCSPAGAVDGLGRLQVECSEWPSQRETTIGLVGRDGRWQPGFTYPHFGYLSATAMPRGLVAWRDNRDDTGWYRGGSIEFADGGRLVADGTMQLRLFADFDGGLLVSRSAMPVHQTLAAPGPTLWQRYDDLGHPLTPAVAAPAEATQAWPDVLGNVLAVWLPAGEPLPRGQWLDGNLAASGTGFRLDRPQGGGSRAIPRAQALPGGGFALSDEQGSPFGVVQPGEARVKPLPPPLLGRPGNAFQVVFSGSAYAVLDSSCEGNQECATRSAEIVTADGTGCGVLRLRGADGSSLPFRLTRSGALIAEPPAPAPPGAPASSTTRWWPDALR